MAFYSARVPRLVAGVDLTELPLSPLEGFVLSRIDGAAPVEVLADLTNLDESEVARIVDRLIEWGAVEWARETVSLPRATGRPPTRPPPQDAAEVKEASSGPPPEHHPPPAGMIRVRPHSDQIRASGGVYRAHESPEDRVDPGRRSDLPSSIPRASHTGSIFPPGEVDEHDERSSPRSGRWYSTTTVRAPSAAPSDSPRRASVEPDVLAFEAESLLAEAAALLAAQSSSADGREGERQEAKALPELLAELEVDEPANESRAAGEELAGAEHAGTVDELPGEFVAVPSSSSTRDERAEEELDLDPDRRKRIDDLYFALDLLDHYQVLGIGKDAERMEIRSAYFQLSKVFHPDTMFRKRLGSYKAKMEAIFQRLTEAYEVLGKKRSRRDYDRYLSIQERTRAVEAVMESPEVATEAEQVERLGRMAAQHEAELAAGRIDSPHETRAVGGGSAAGSESAVPGSTISAGSDAPPRSTMSEAGRRRARELMAKKLRHAARASSAGRRRIETPRPSSVAPASAPDRAEVVRSLARSLAETSGQTGGLDQVKRYVLRADDAERRGELAEAAQSLRLAVMLAPQREDLRQRHARINAALAASLATSYEEQALYEQRHGKWGAAALSWAKVFEGRPTDARAARSAAEALIEANGDLHRARELAQRAAELEPDKVENLRVLGRVYLAAGLLLNARRVLTRAAALDPGDEIVENLLRDMDGA